jgi:crotonobetaine/carnitine-CoA ligase
VALTVAVSALGAVEVPVTADHSDPQLEQLLGRSTVLVGTTDSPTRLGLGDRIATHPPLLSVDGPSPGLTDDHPRASTVVPLSLAPDAPALVMTTSGTTGRSKAALLPAGAPVAQARRVARAMAYTSRDTLLSFFGWHHINARNATVLPAVLSGARVVFAPRFSASGFLDTVRAEGVTSFNFMGAVCAMLLAQEPTPGDRDHRLRTAYGGPAPRWLVEAFAHRFGVLLRQAYACTELGDVANTPPDRLVPGSAGRVDADYDVRVVGEDGQPVAPGSIGELQVRPRRPGLAVLEYLDSPEQTEEAWEQGWFRTRDRVRIDGGWLHVEGRLGDVIRRRGSNIDPSRVEEGLLRHPAVCEAVAVGVPSELTEDDILVLVRLRAGAATTPRELWEHCRAQLPRAMVPRYLALDGQIPLNGSMKVDRRMVKEQGVPPHAWDADHETEAVNAP